MSKHTAQELKQFQAMSLDEKIAMTKTRIIAWHDWCFSPMNDYNGFYVSFSGGKDSTVLLNIVRQIYPDTPAVFFDTGLEYPEIREFVKTFDNVIWIRPEMSFYETIRKYGYPFIRKEVAECIYDVKHGGYGYRVDKLNGTAVDKDGNLSLYNLKKWKPLLDVDFEVAGKCCSDMKKKPSREIQKNMNMLVMTAMMTEESKLREQTWLRYGCNGFDMKNPRSIPMAFWTEQDVLEYIRRFNLPIAEDYGEIVFQCNGCEYADNLIGEGKLKTTGLSRTGCAFCGFGAHLEKGEGRFQYLKRKYPKLYDYCMNGGEYDDNGVWKPNKQGLGMRHCIEELNKLYGEGFIKI